MNTLLASLKKYLTENHPDVIKKDWAKSKHLKNVGPTVEEFLSSYPGKLYKPSKPRSNKQ